ncbi:MAG: SDR family oxidoreductase [Myxococcota bacterium]
MPRVLVTGGAGFIGSHLVEATLHRGWSVRVLDDFSTGRRENLAPFLDEIDLHEGNLADIDDVRFAVEGTDYILHQGALPSVPKSLKHPRTTNEANVTGTLNILVAARDAGVSRVVFAASSSAYGDTPTLPKQEDMPTQPKSPYAIQKLTGEMYCRTFWEHFGLETVALRYFNIFGPRQDPTSPYSAVIPKFVTACMEDEAPRINGDGQISRDFTFIENVVDANLKACTATSKCAGQVMNVACGRRVSLNELAETIRKAVDRGKAPVHGPERPGDVLHSLADISRAEELIGYTPVVDFDRGIERTVGWYMEQA